MCPLRQTCKKWNGWDLTGHILAFDWKDSRKLYNTYVSHISHLGMYMIQVNVTLSRGQQQWQGEIIQ